jgi:hypothetical protein
VLGNASALPRPAFVIGDYADGALFEVPTECPARSMEGPCDVVLHTLRSRKTGPPHPLAVCRCHAHGLFFAIYPPGFVPYSRRPLLEAPGAPATETPSFASVAREAADGVAWTRAAVGGTDRWWTTQTRLLRRLAWAVGGLAGSSRDLVAVAIGLPLRLLARVAEAAGFRARGRTLIDVLDALGDDLDRLLLAGALAGCWGAPWRWQRAPPRLVPVVPAHLVDLAKRSTTSGPRAPPPSS